MEIDEKGTVEKLVDLLLKANEVQEIKTYKQAKALIKLKFYNDIIENSKDNAWVLDTKKRKRMGKFIKKFTTKALNGMRKELKKEKD